ncbi:MAG: RNA 2',3'-cyclic phosphodiesterase [Candidatus Thermoplasmatota archaeon]
MRLFVGLPVPDSALYEAAKRDLVQAASDARVVPPGSHHVTVRFLGEMAEPDGVIAALDRACNGRPALPCVVEGLGSFPGGGFPADKKARVAWAGLRAPGVEALAQTVLEATARFGEPPERRPFVAHVTLARMARPADLRLVIEQHRRTLFAEGVLDRVVLYSSTPTPRGSAYEAEHTVRLGR